MRMRTGFLYGEDDERQAEVEEIPESERGYRYDVAAVDEAAGRIVTDIGGPTEEHWKDDPRNAAQAVLDIFIAAGVVVALDLGYEARLVEQGATILRLDDALCGLRAELAGALREAASYRQKYERARQVYAPDICGVPGCNCDGRWR